MSVMKLPKNVAIEIKQDESMICINVTAAIENKQAAEDVIEAIRRFSAVLPDKIRRPRKPKDAAEEQKPPRSEAA